MTAPLCPCGSGDAFSACCRPLLKGAPASTAESLMRSRYTAYVRRDERYLLATWHQDTRPPSLGLAADTTQWRGLYVVSTVAGGRDDVVGEVTFCAHFVDDGGAQALRETSRFVRLDGVWLYLDGDVT